MLFLFSHSNKSGILSLSRYLHNDPQKLSPYTKLPTMFRKEFHDIPEKERAWNIPSFLCKNRLPSSMTIEASLCLSVFLVFMISLCQLFLVMQLQLRMQKALERVGNEVAQYCYITSQIPLWDSQSQWIEKLQEYLLAEVSEEAIRLRFVDVMGQQALEDSILVQGSQGVSFDKSQLQEEYGVFRLVVSYQIRLPIALWGFEDVALEQQCYRYGLLGDREPAKAQPEQEDKVYVTKYGQVYHVTLSCTHLNLSVRSVSMTQIPEIRNEEGEAYLPCELCRPTGGETAVYVTKEGDRYHEEKTCGGIRRHITAIPVSQIQGRRPCSRCGKEEG